jgi:hypothetical protein
MKYVRFTLIIVVLVISIIPPVMAQKVNMSASKQALDYYLDLVRSENYYSALGLWDQDIIKSSQRLGIEFENIPVKADFDSPIMQQLQMIRQFDCGFISESPLDDFVVRFKFYLRTGQDKIMYDYLVEQNGSYPWITLPIDFYSSSWISFDSKYFRFHYDPELEDLLNLTAVERLNHFVEEISDVLGISVERLEKLKSAKIDYYLCKDLQQVRKLTGQSRQGVYLPSLDAVVASTNADFHNIARLMVNFGLEKLSPQTSAFLQEGLASALGGHWDRAPSVVFDFGEYIFRYGLVELDSILCYDPISDTIGTFDIIPPVAACLTDYLFSKLGRDEFFTLYRNLSGSRGYIDSLEIGNVKDKITEALNTDWAKFAENFSEIMNSGDNFRGLIMPGISKSNETIIDDTCGLVLSISDNQINVDFISNDTLNYNIALLFGLDSNLKDKTSKLFKAQFGQKKEFKGYRWGLVLDQNEIGLYDYATNGIIAKFINDVTSVSDYFNNDEKRIRASFDQNLVETSTIDFGDYQIIR